MKKVRLTSITQDIDINPNDKKDIKNTILVWIFSLLADLERTFISQRTKDALKARVAKGVKLGKPVGTIQESIYDKDEEIIFELLEHEVPVKRISRKLKYGTYQSLRYFIERRRKNIKDTLHQHQ